MIDKKETLEQMIAKRQVADSKLEPLQSNRCITGEGNARSLNRTAMSTTQGPSGILAARNMGETIHHNDRMQRWHMTG